MKNIQDLMQLTYSNAESKTKDVRQLKSQQVTATNSDTENWGTNQTKPQENTR
jgi:hypothetical protein